MQLMLHNIVVYVCYCQWYKLWMCCHSNATVHSL